MMSFRGLNRLLLPVVGAAAALSFATGAFGQGSPPPAKTWVEVEPGAPQGTAAIVDIVENQSSATQTVVDVAIQGFWRWTVVGPDGIAYDRYEFPGLESVGAVGAPEIPVVRFEIAVASSALQVQLAQTLTNQQAVFVGQNVYPAPLPEVFGDDGQGGSMTVPEQFVKNAVTYATNSAFPAQANSFSVHLGPGSVRSASVVLAPVTVNPVSQQLAVLRGVRYVLAHSGLPLAVPPLPKDLSKLAAATHPNWQPVAPNFASNDVEYEGRYLIVAPATWLPALEEFIAFRKASGFAVSTRTLESLPATTPAAIRSAIQAWHSAGDPEASAFCLLVGSSEVIPHDLAPTDPPVSTDDLYGDFDADFTKEVFVGRLPVDKSWQIPTLLDKVIHYETSPNFTDHYNRAVLVGHYEDGPTEKAGKYLSDVVNADYAVQPSFASFWGGDAAANNAGVTAAIDAGAGIVAYVGHGTTTGWYHWNLQDENFGASKIAALQNYSLNSVFWNIGCSMHLPTPGSDNMGELLLKLPGRGAVSSYACTSLGGWKQAEVLYENLFYAVFSAGLTTQAHAIQFAEAKCRDTYPDATATNPWCYTLYGDPAMRIRRDAPKPIVLGVPSVVDDSCAGPSCFLSLQVKDGSGAPLQGVMVGAYKSGASPAVGDEVFANAYSDVNGEVRLPIAIQSLGAITVVARDDEGNAARVEIPVKFGAWTDLGDSKLGSAGLPRLTGTGNLVPGSAAQIDLTAAAPGTAALLLVSTLDTPTPFLGSVLHPLPVMFSLPLVTDASGESHLPIPAWPAFAPGFELVMQTVIADADAKYGVAVSNALKATQP